jgi:hemerythrin superfamily protein
MNPVDIIKEDHRRLEGLFAKFLETDSEVTQETLFEEIEAGLNTHSEMEERVLYPALRQFAPEKVDIAIDEHSQVRELLLELLESDLNEDAFESRFNRLIEDVRHHVEEEESPNGLLALAQQHLNSAQLSVMARDLLIVKNEIEEDLAA